VQGLGAVPNPPIGAGCGGPIPALRNEPLDEREGRCRRVAAGVDLTVHVAAINIWLRDRDGKFTGSRQPVPVLDRVGVGAFAGVNKSREPACGGGR
jgi:hypothetical protein